MEPRLFIAYCTTIFIASVVPGPSMFLALAQGARYGAIGGFYSALGNVVASLLQGIISYVILLQLGIFSASILLWLKIIGAVYIIYLGWGLLGAKFDSQVFKKDDKDVQECDNSGKNIIKAFIDGFIVALLNPKAIIFFVALFPQFVRPGENINTQLLAILLPIGLIAAICFMLYVMAGIQLVRFIGNSLYMGKVFGAFLIVSGLLFLLT